MKVTQYERNRVALITKEGKEVYAHFPTYTDAYEWAKDQMTENVFEDFRIDWI